MKKKIIALLCVMANLVTVSHAAEMGVCTLIGYQGEANRVVKLADDIGAEWIRDGYRWQYLEQQKGVLSASNVSDKLLPETTSAHGKKLQMVLGFGNPLYNSLFQKSNVIMPETSNSAYFSAWLNYVRFVANTWGNCIDAYSVWNEPNIRAFNKYQVGGSVYAELLRQTYNTLKGIDPTALVVGGELSTGGASYLDDMLAAGAKNYMDVLSIHTYDHSSNGPEASFRTVWDGYETVLDKYSFDKEIWLDETGWYTGTAENAKTENQQAAYAIRSAVLWEDYLKDNDRTGKIMWYDLADSGSDASDSEQNFGLTDSDLVQKKSYNAVKTYNRLMQKLDFSSLSVNGTIYKGQYTNEETNDTTYVLWTTANSAQNVTVNLSGDKVYVYNFVGSLLEEIKSPSGTKTISVTGEPKYVVCSNNVTQIKDTRYDADKNVITVKGESGASEVTVRIIQEGVVKTTSTGKVDDGRFTCEISPTVFGTITLEVVPDEGVGEFKELSIEPTVNPYGRNIEFSGFRAGYRQGAETATISCTTGEALDNDELTILVTRESANVNSLTSAQVIHIGQTTVSGTELTYSFGIPDATAGVYQVYVGGSFAKQSSNKLLSPYIKVGSFTIDIESSGIEVNVEATNENYYASPYVIYVAQYDADGRLISANKVDGTISANGELSNSYSFDSFITSDAAKAEAFIWESSKQIPLYPYQAAE